MLANPVALLRRMPATVRLLVFGTFVNKLGGFVLPYLTIVLQRDFRLTATQTGLLMSGYGVGAIVAILAGGWLADRFGRRLTMLVSLGGGGLLAVGMALAPSALVFIPLLVLFGFLADLYRPAASAIISDLLPSAQRATGFAALRTAVNLGFCVGVVVGGLLADWSWRLLFLGDGLTTMLFGGIVALFIAETRPASAAPLAPAALPGSPWRDAVFLQAVLASFAFCLIFSNFLSVLPLTITLSAGYPAPVYGGLMAVNGLLIGVLEMVVVDSLRRLRRLRVAALGQLLAGLGFALTGLLMHWAWFLMTVLVWTAGEILCSPQQTAFVADWAPPSARGRYLSVYQVSWSVAFAVNPIVALPLHARLGERVFWPLLLTVAAPAAALLLHLDRTADRPERLQGLTGVSEDSRGRADE